MYLTYPAKLGDFEVPVEVKFHFQLKRCRPQGIVISTSPTGAFSRLSSSGTVDVCGR